MFKEGLEGNSHQVGRGPTIWGAPPRHVPSSNTPRLRWGEILSPWQQHEPLPLSDQELCWWTSSRENSSRIAKEDMTTNGRKKSRGTNIYEDPNQKRHMETSCRSALLRLPMRGGVLMIPKLNGLIHQARFGSLDTKPTWPKIKLGIASPPYTSSPRLSTLLACYIYIPRVLFQSALAFVKLIISYN